MKDKLPSKKIYKDLPNLLTIIRILLVPVFIIVLWLPMMTGGYIDEFAVRIICACIFAVAALTDFIDGRYARKHGLVTNFGKFMDPLADKFLIIGALLAAVPVFEEFSLAIVISLIIIIFRELAVTSMRLVAKNTDNIVIAAAMPGKIKTFSQCIFVLLLLLEDYVFAFSEFFVTYRPLTWICMAVMVFFTIYSGLQYFAAYKKYIVDR